jgi:hypothetical protein
MFQLLDNPEYCILHQLQSPRQKHQCESQREFVRVTGTSQRQFQMRWMVPKTSLFNESTPDCASQTPAAALVSHAVNEDELYTHPSTGDRIDSSTPRTNRWRLTRVRPKGMPSSSARVGPPTITGSSYGYLANSPHRQTFTSLRAHRRHPRPQSVHSKYSRRSPTPHRPSPHQNL